MVMAVGLGLCVLSFGLMGGNLRAGAHAEEIKPKLPISMAGSMTDQIARSIHDPIYARCLLLQTDSDQVAFVNCDSCMIVREVMDEAKKEIESKFGIPGECIIISATHSHSCPTSARVFQSEPNPEYQKELVRAITASVAQAKENLASAMVDWGVTPCPGEIFNRRWRMKEGTIPKDPFGRTTDRVQMNPPPGSENLIEPAGPTDPAITVLYATHEDGSPLGAMANYSLHYVGGVGPNEISADYFGEVSRLLQGDGPTRDGHPPPMVMMTNGASGNVNNVNFKKITGRREPYEQIQHVAREVAGPVRGILRQPAMQSDVVLGGIRREIELRVRKPTEEDIKSANTILESAKGTPLTTIPAIYAQETLHLAEYPETVRLWIQVVRVGDAAFVAIPCEVFAEIGLSIKSKSPFETTAIIELANGYNGYLPTPEQHALGGYETWRAKSSYLEVEASVHIERTALELLDSLAKDLP